MEDKKIKPEIKDLGTAKDIIKGGLFNKEIDTASDSFFDDEGNPMSVPD